ncbi:hypothetical protein BU16DRAFT_366592 [Lophium mytilinum]|uniref:Uncharacterized protein n=1 Tax=Lophium mytilinum TaxID=390894 RepID=A0A6A6QVD0_9PEZI|nr:hypothetical protein BU16DRAFT_366592 [Lophium mytilinum]
MDNAIAGAVAYRRHDLPAGLAIPEAIMTASCCRCQPPWADGQTHLWLSISRPTSSPGNEESGHTAGLPFTERRAGVRGPAAVGDVVVGKAPRSTDFEARIPRANTHRKHPHLAPTAGHVSGRPRFQPGLNFGESKAACLSTYGFLGGPTWPMPILQRIAAWRPDHHPPARPGPASITVTA